WDLWKECLTQPDFDNTANTLIPMGTKEDPFWQGSGRTIFAEAAYLMRNDPRGAEQLGLQGSVDKDVFTRLLEGRLPDGADLSRMQDGSNRHRPGYDLTFSAPKSVSMMAM
uniref:relaxase domain-containing protein n=1 Tax=Escherichia coli TaxID=562 RepID=UPI00207BDDD4